MAWCGMPMEPRILLNRLILLLSSALILMVVICIKFGEAGIVFGSLPIEGSDCEDTEVTGLSFCPNLADMLPILLENKRSLLRLSLDALTASRSESNIMMTTLLAQETADVFYTKAGEQRSWNDAHRHDTFSECIEDFFTTKLRRRRPVLINVRGGDVCSLLAQLTLPPAPENSDSKDSDPDILLRLDDEPLKPVGTTPLALLTSGWDGNGSPFGGSSHDWDRCAHKILDLPQVAIWFVSHQRGNQILPKVEYLGVGFGGTEPRSGLDPSVYAPAVRDRLRSLESCTDDKAGTLDLLFMCNSDSSNTPRPAINAALTTPQEIGSDQSEEEPAKVIATNRFPMDSHDTLIASMDALFSVSPAGTRPDCFRHYEMALAGSIVYVSDSASLRYVLAGLPVVFVEGGASGWANITCDMMAKHAMEVAERLRKGRERGADPPFQFDKLTLEYWKLFVRDRVWAAGAAIRANETLEITAAIDSNMIMGPP